MSKYVKNTFVSLDIFSPAVLKTVTLNWLFKNSYYTFFYLTLRKTLFKLTFVCENGGTGDEEFC